MDEWKDGDAKWGSSKVRRFRLDPATASRPSTVRTTVRFLSNSASCCTSVLYGRAVPHQRPAPACACTCTLGHPFSQRHQSQNLVFVFFLPFEKEHPVSRLKAKTFPVQYASRKGHTRWRRDGGSGGNPRL
jgi:hypothetical protein